MLQDSATIIRLTKLTETSLIVSWITEHHGLVKTVAKGARRPKSQYAGLIDLFYSAEIAWTASQKSELHTLTEVSPLDYRQPLRTSYKNTELAAYFAVLLEAVAEPDIPADGFLDLLNRALDYLCENEANLKALFHFERELCKMLGVYSPSKQADRTLIDAIGSLPANRQRCLNLLEANN